MDLYHIYKLKSWLNVWLSAKRIKKKDSATDMKTMVYIEECCLSKFRKDAVMPLNILSK